MVRDRNENEYFIERDKKLNLKPINNIAEICHQHGLKNAILSPGSRCAPLTFAFTRHDHFLCKTISDERSAAFIALGMAQQTKTASVLVCTSGSAALNYAPAVAEAYFQQIPLLILTADRPPEWIDQLDGQTIRQQAIYGKHVKESYQFPADLTHQDAEWHANRLISEAINSAHTYPMGPVHVNLPFREPFYPEKDETTKYDKNVKIIKQFSSDYNLSESQWKTIIGEWKNANRKLIIGGQQSPSEFLLKSLSQISNEQKVPIIGDVISNLHAVDKVVAHADLFLGQSKSGLHESLKPELIVTFGNSTISKNLKLFLRTNPAISHWHIQEAGQVADTFKSLTQVINTSPEKFFTQISEAKSDEDFYTQKQENYFQLWQIEERKVNRHLNSFFPQEKLGELEVVHQLITQLNNVALHLANSMSVRYGNLIGLTNKSVEIFANRGTSGIDGSTSTAVGSSFASDKITYLITGDMAFFYDRNAFWHNYPLNNLKILVLNNHAGGIFRMINGPSDQPELEEFFETKQTLSAKHLAEEFGIEFIKCDRHSKLNNQIKNFIEEPAPIIMEIETDSKLNKEIFDDFKNAFKALD